MEKRRIEILAPAGSYASFKSCDQTQERMLCTPEVRNLEQEHMRIILQKERVDRKRSKEAHIYGRKLYLTVKYTAEKNKRKFQKLPEISESAL